MTPKCCENCSQLNSKGGCGHFNVCGRWRAWFREEWRRIRAAAAKIKEGKDDKGRTKDL